MTQQQRNLLRFIERHIAATDGVAPSFAEMEAAMGLSSKSGIHRLLTALEEQGYIRRFPQRARGIELVPTHVDLSAVPDAVIAAEHQRRLHRQAQHLSASTATGACL